MEVVGAVAATSQLLAGALKILEGIIQLREYLKHAPSQLQHWQAELAVLESAIDFIRDDPKLQTPNIARFINTITSKIENLTHLCPRSVPSKKSVKYLVGIIPARAAQSRILQNFADLDRDKITLILAIQAICGPQLRNHSDQDRTMYGPGRRLGSASGSSSETVQVDQARGPAADSSSRDHPPGSPSPSQGTNAALSEAPQVSTKPEGRDTLTNITLIGNGCLFGTTANARPIYVDNYKANGNDRVDGRHSDAVVLAWASRTPRPRDPVLEQPQDGSTAPTNANSNPKPMDVDS